MDLHASKADSDGTFLKCKTDLITVYVQLLNLVYLNNLTCGASSINEVLCSKTLNYTCLGCLILVT